VHSHEMPCQGRSTHSQVICGKYEELLWVLRTKHRAHACLHLTHVTNITHCAALSALYIRHASFAFIDIDGLFCIPDFALIYIDLH